MRKPSRKKWQFKNLDFDSSLALAAGVGISPFAAQLLINRGVRTVTEARAYLYPTFDELHSPFALAGMEKAVERIHRAIARGEKICIYGDYDVDGTTATALLVHTFRELGVEGVDYYIPERFGDGYGLSETTVERVHEEKKANLLITVDCGITSVKPVAFANELGIDVIVTDHHQPKAEQPAAYALISPKMPGNEYPYTELAGVGLAFKLAQGLVEDRNFLESKLDLVALGTVADMVPLTGENRILSRLGLTELDKRELPGIHALCQVAGQNIDTPIDGEAISYKLAPRINAAGRLDTAYKVVDLLTTDSKEVAARIAAQLNSLNQDRQKLGRQIEDDAEEIIENKIDQDTVGIVVESAEWGDKAQGVVGIVASRLMRDYHRPIIVLAVNGERATGSGRCIPGMNLADGLVACTALLVKHGGHAAAAGLTIDTKNIPKFRGAFDAYAREQLTAEALEPTLDLEFETQLSLLTLETLRELERFEPFGVENRSPLFGARRVKVDGKPSLMGPEKNHLQMTLSDGRVKLRAIEWRAGEKLVTFKRPNMSLDIAFAPQINEWQGRCSVELRLEDWEIHSEGRGANWDVFPKLEDSSAVKLVDRRDTEKKGYLLKVLAREAPCIIYVRDEDMLDTLLTKLLPESLEGVARHTESTSPAEETALLRQLANGEIRTIVSSGVFASVETFPFVEHVVFCHLAPSEERFSSQCKPAFATPETTYLHLIYSDADVAETQAWIAKKYPEDTELRQLYGALRSVLQSNGADGYPEAEILRVAQVAPVTLETGLAIFEELRFTERHGQPGNILVRLLPHQKRELSHSPTYLKGQWIKRTSPVFIDFQLKESIESMWERIENEHRNLN